jgi:hypothetical protein
MQTPSTRDIRVVTFSERVTIHPLVTWSFAYRQARGGAQHWVADRIRFQKRVEELEKKLNGGSIQTKLIYNDMRTNRERENGMG